MEPQALAAGGHLGGHGGLVREAHPKDASLEKAAIPVDKFTGELRLADASQPGGGGDLANGGGLPYGRSLPFSPVGSCAKAAAHSAIPKREPR